MGQVPQSHHQQVFDVDDGRLKRAGMVKPLPLLATLLAYRRHQALEFQAEENIEHCRIVVSSSHVFLFCSAQGFPQLEILKLDDDDRLEEWQVEEGAMPKLRGLTIPENPKMRISKRLREIPRPNE
ncbi:hypothetical protein EZV62_006689 [Acer yangbiense]|uniref:Uncharacterized protein n=1 Tax=Acer yangbiense TaxID=1000413 RepID=A0A5C7I8B0_9ROSI|nr:hypothetical protein EZV62_006689 [Acer yangbiense]